MTSASVIYYLFFKKMVNTYSIKFKTIFFELKKYQKKIARTEAKIYYWIFLKNNDLLPPFCKVMNKSLYKNNPQETKRFELKILQKQIQINRRYLIEYKNLLHKLKNLFIKNFPEHDVITTFYHLNNYKKYLDNQSYKIIKKRKQFIMLKYKIKPNLRNEDKIRKTTQNMEKNGFINLSKIKLETEEIIFLNSGPKSTIITNYNKYEDIKIKTDIEIISRSFVLNQHNDLNIQNLDQEQKQSLNLFSTSIKDDIKKHKYPIETNDAKYIKTISQKIMQNNLVIITADKSNTLVLLEKETYVTKMEKALEKNKFKKVNKDNREKNERSIQALLRICLKDEVMTYTTYKSIYPSSSPPASIYGKIKLHKPSLDIRPIVNTKSSYISGLSKWLIQALKKYTNKKFVVKNSLDLKEHLKNIEIKHNYYMISLDVESMFGSIDLQAVINYILTRYQFDSDKPFTFKSEKSLDMLNQMLYFCTQDITCNFNGSAYIQENGCGMGLNLSPLLCEIQMWLIENKIMNTIGVGRGKDAFIITYRRYVDDLYFIISHPKHINTLLNLANNISLNIKFTLEEEKNGLLNFLDITIIRSPTSLDFSIFRKSTQNEIKINFNSQYDKEIITNNLKQEIIRAYRICSTENLLMLELKTIENIYLLNDYPKVFIHYHINRINIQFCTKINLGKINYKNLAEIDKKMSYITLESKMFIDILKKHFKILNANECWNLNKEIFIVKRAPETLQRALIHINVIGNDKELKKYNLYSYKCDCGSIYIGNTMRSLKIRALEHSKQSNSQIYLHSNNTGHKIDLNNFSTLMHQSNVTKRFVMERFLIDKFKADLNIEKGITLITEQI